jgi:hypothetical protein
LDKVLIFTMCFKILKQISLFFIQMMTKIAMILQILTKFQKYSDLYIYAILSIKKKREKNKSNLIPKINHVSNDETKVYTN